MLGLDGLETGSWHWEVSAGRPIPSWRDGSGALLEVVPRTMGNAMLPWRAFFCRAQDHR